MKTLALLALLLSAAFASGVTLQWDASPTSNVVGYRIKWGFGQGGPYPHMVEAGSALSITIEEPWPLGSTVYFTAYAYNALGMESLPSNEAVYAVPIPTPVPTPTPAPTPAPPNNLRLILDAIARWWSSLFPGA